MRAPASNLSLACTGFDFDGVIADTVTAFVRIACEDYGHCGVTLEDFSAFDTAPLARDIMDEIFDFLTREPLLGGIQPMPGVTRVLPRLCAQGMLTIVTARPDAGPVEAWLAHFFTRETCAQIRVIAAGGPDGKEPFIREAGLSTFIDDRAETCVALARAGIDARVFAQPWNRMLHARLPVLHDWQEIGSLLGAGQEPAFNPLKSHEYTP